MEWLIGLIALSAVIVTMWLFRRAAGSGRGRDDASKPARRPRRKGSAVLASRTTVAPCATILSDKPVPATAEDVRSLLKSVKEEAAACRKMAQHMLNSAETALATGRVDPAFVRDAESALARVRATIEYAEGVMDRYFSEFDTADGRWWILIERTHELETELEAALSDVRLVQASPQDAGWFAYPP